MKLRLSIFVISFLIIFKASAAQPQSVINTALSCKKVRECPYFDELYNNDPNFRNAFLNLLKQHGEKKPAWIPNGVITPAVPLLIDKHIYLNYICMQTSFLPFY